MLSLLTPICYLAKALEHFTDPFLLGAFGLTLVPMLATVFVRTATLRPRARRVAPWDLHNGSIIHILMDGLVGTHGLEGICGAEGLGIHFVSCLQLSLYRSF